MLRFIRDIFEKRIFGLSSFLADKLHVRVSFVRIIFIYATFTNALTILLYLAMLFTLRLSYHFMYKKRKSVFDL